MPFSNTRAWIELTRLPNVFTAMADIGMGFLFTHAAVRAADGGRLALLLLISAALYTAGMVLNDAFDAAADAHERPRRPIPSGRISLIAAQRLGWILLGLGTAAGTLAGPLMGQWRTSAVTLGLAASVVGYDALLKRTAAGPLAMGACRALNALLGMSMAAEGWRGEHWLVAGALGIYITGVTWYARTEARRSGRWSLAGATLVVLGGIALLAPLPGQMEAPIDAVLRNPARWHLLIAALGFLIGRRLFAGIIEPGPRRVQQAVTQSLRSLVILDAAVAFLVHDVPGAVPILLLLVPMLVLGRWASST